MTLGTNGDARETETIPTGVSLIGPLEETGVRDAWPKIVGYMSAALDRDGGKLTEGDLFKQIADGMMGIYVVVDFATGEILAGIACEVQEYPQSMVFNLAYCGGKSLERWADLFCQFEVEAVRLGCDTVRITGRSGWGRIFPDYQETNRIFERKVIQ